MATQDRILTDAGGPGIVPFEVAALAGETTRVPPAALAAAIPEFALTTTASVYALAGLVLGRR